MLVVTAGAHLAQQTVTRDQELGHGLGRLSGLRDDVERRLFQIGLGQQSREGDGVDVVDDVDAHAPVPVAHMESGLDRRLRPESRTADAEDDEAVEPLPQTRRQFVRLRDGGFCVRQFQEREQAFLAALTEVADH